ncbi:MAG: peptide chain release factor N(5)-glutamine methyltransferase [Phycisphaeraceae bacterium]|nr:peptide chain release factor N(5)-glutamine methyltransferase [Phycisphaeraceae bacterium]
MADTWTTRRLLAWTAEHFERKGIDSPRLSAEMLLAHVLEVDRLRLYMDPDRPASDLERAAFRELVERAARYEPVDYLVGQTSFFSMMFEVAPDVLVPRPSTETLVEHVIQHARITPGFREPLTADVGTGSGIIAVTLAKHIEGSSAFASDISEAALAVAKKNAERHKVADRIEFAPGNLLEPVLERYKGRVRYLCSNPPYIPDDEWAKVEPNVKDYEPTLALRGGIDGLDYIRPLIAGAVQVLDTPGQLVLEIAAVNAEKVVKLAEEAGLQGAHVLADHEALPRVLVAEKR